LIWQFSIHATPTSGPLFVQAQLPAIYEALESTFGADETKRFLDDWGEHEVEYIRNKLHGFFRALKNDNDTGASRADLYRRFQTLIKGTLGEAYGLHELRKHAADLTHPFTIMDELEYQAQNKSKLERSRPDGILYSVDSRSFPRRLIIHKLLESKVGGANYSIAQVNRYMALWLKNGLRAGNEHFHPEQIIIKESAFEIALPQATMEHLRQITLLVNRNPINRHPKDLVLDFLDGGGLSAFTQRLIGAGLSDEKFWEFVERLPPTRRRTKVIDFVKARFDGGEITFPRSGATDREERKFGQLINSDFDGVADLFRSLPEKYQELSIGAGFDPRNAKRSAQSMWDNRDRRKEVLHFTMRRFDSGNVTFPSSVESGEGQLMAGFITRLYGGLAKFYADLPPKYRTMAIEAGFDLANPLGSAQKMRNKQKGFSPESRRREVLLYIQQQFESGSITFPSLLDEGKAREVALLIQRHFKGLEDVYAHLSPQHQKLVSFQGFDPKNPKTATTMRAKRRIDLDREYILNYITKRFDSGDFTFPSTLDEGEGARVAERVNKIFGNLVGLFEALSQNDKKRALEAGFSPDNPWGSSRHMRDKYSVRDQVIDYMISQFDQGNISFPRAHSAGAEGKMGNRIHHHFGGVLGLYDALPSRYQVMARSAGFDPTNPVSSSQAMRRSKSAKKCNFEKLAPVIGAARRKDEVL